VALLVLLLALAGVGFAADAGYRHGDPRPRGADGPNGLWATHRWVGEARQPSEYAALADLLRRERITDLFVHVGPLEADGTIPATRYPHARELLAALHAAAPGVRIQAWIGQRAVRAGGLLDLASERTRATVAGTAGSFLDAGFDGIHYDVEPVRSGDPHFLELLRRTRALTGARGRLLSVATPGLEPFVLARPVTWAGAFWTTGYYQSVAATVDQVAVMTYTVGVPVDWLYGSYLGRETRALARTLDPRVTLLMGVPTYDEDAGHFDARAENMRSGVRGVAKGLAGLPPARRARVGVAIYADWTTDPAEWATFRRAWLGLADQR
jgi:hypothetical protein